MPSCDVYNLLISTPPRIAQVIVGSLFSLFFFVLRLAALRLPPCGTLSKATGFLHVPLSAATLRQKQEIAEKAIDATYAFFESINIPMHLREVGIDDSRIDEMAHHIAVNEGLENAYAPLTEQDIKEILVASL